MGCAALFSWLLSQPRRTFPHDRLRGCRVRPLCHLSVRQQTWSDTFVKPLFLCPVAAGLRFWESRSDFHAWRSGPGVNFRPVPQPGKQATEADRLCFWPTQPKRCEPSCRPVRLLVPALQHGAGSVHEQFSQVRVSALTDPQLELNGLRSWDNCLPTFEDSNCDF